MWCGSGFFFLFTLFDLEPMGLNFTSIETIKKHNDDKDAESDTEEKRVYRAMRLALIAYEEKETTK